MLTPEIIQFFINGGGHAALAIGVIVLWQKSERLEKALLRATNRLSKIEADLTNCMDDHIRDLEKMSQQSSTINTLQAAADERNRFIRR